MTERNQANFPTWTIVGASIAAVFCLYNAYGYGAIDSDSAVTHHWHIEDMQKDSDDSDTMVAAKAVGRVATWQHTIPGIQEDVSNGAVAAYELTAAALIMSRRRR